MCRAMCETPKDQDRFHFRATDNISKLQIIKVPPGSQGGVVLEDNMKMMQFPSSHGLYTGLHKKNKHRVEVLGPAGSTPGSILILQRAVA